MTFDEAWAIVGPNSLLGEPRSRVLYNLLKLAPVGGNIAEVGVYQGWTARLMQLTRPKSTLHLFDTFAGIQGANSNIDKHVDGEFACSKHEVSKRLDAPVVLHEGLFPDTFYKWRFVPAIFDFVHVDGDTYFCAESALTAFWPWMQRGGILLFDDYRYDPCPGIEKALTEWSASTGIEVMVSPTGGQAFVIKP